MQLLVDPERPKHRYQNVGQGAQRFQAQTALDECGRFHQDVVRGDEIPFLDYCALPGVDHFGVPGLVRIKERKKRRSVDKEAHGSNASSR